MMKQIFSFAKLVLFYGTDIHRSKDLDFMLQLLDVHFDRLLLLVALHPAAGRIPSEQKCCLLLNLW